MIKILKPSTYILAAVFSVFVGLFLLFQTKIVFAFGILLIIALVGAYYFMAIGKPVLAVLLIPIGSYMGYLFQVFRDAPIPFSLFQIFLLLGFLVFLFHKINTGNFTVKITRLELEFLIFLALIYFSLIYSPNRADGLLYATRFFILVLMVYLFFNTVTNPKQIGLIIATILVISIVLGILSIKEGLLNTEAALWNFFTMGQRLTSRATGIQRDPNIFASHFFLPILFTAAVVMVKGQQMKFRVLGFGLFSVYFLSIISTFSRSAWVAMLLALLFLAILLKQYKMIFYLLLIGILALVFVPNFSIVVTNVLRRFLGIFAGESDYSSKVRILLGTGALNMFFGSYLIGVGFRGFPVVFPTYISTQKTFGIVEPHNVFYTVLAELGLLGFLLFGWIIWKIYRIGYNNFKLSGSYLEKIISATLLSVFVSYIIFYQFYVDGLLDNNFWITVGLMYSLNYYLGARHRMDGT